MAESKRMAKTTRRGEKKKEMKRNGEGDVENKMEEKGREFTES